MPVPILTDLTHARQTILRRVPFDAMPVPQSLQDGIAARFGERLTPAQAVERVLADVRERGDAALHEWTYRLDGVQLDRFELGAQDFAAAAARLDPNQLAALQLAADQLERFHLRQQRNSWTDFSVEGVFGQLVVPLQRVGIYVPGGAAPLPSSLLHAAIPARVAGVAELIVCTPPNPRWAAPCAAGYYARGSPHCRCAASVYTGWRTGYRGTGLRDAQRAPSGQDCRPR